MNARQEKFWHIFRWAAPLYIGIFVGIIVWYFGGVSPMIAAAVALIVGVSDFYLLKWLLPRLQNRN